MNTVVRASATLALTLGALLASSTALAVDSGDILVVSLKGEVYVTMSGAKRAVRAGSTLDPPATLRTGRDGAVELRQGATTLSVGPETVLEFPALEKHGAPIDRIVQPRGNVFYNIGKREGRKLRIETPYLVGVVKGTQFNVAAQDETTTISLFEGLLEVHAADESGIVDLRAGEIASRQRDDKGVNVLKMDGAKAPATPRQPAGSGSNNSAPKPTPPRATPQRPDRNSVLVESSVAAVGVGASVAEVAVPREPAPASVETGAAVSVSSPAVEVSMTTVDAGPASVDTGAAVSVSTPAVDVSTSTGVDVGAVTVDTSSVADATTGPLATDLSAGAAVDLDSGSTSTGVTVGASAGQVEVNVGSSTAADAVAGTVNLGLEIAAGNRDLGVDLGVDLGLDDSATTDTGNSGPGNSNNTDNSGPGNGNDNSGPGGPPTDVVELLDGLVNRRGKK